MVTRKGLAILMGLATLTVPAMARDFGFSFSYDRGDRCYSRPVVYDCYRPPTVVYTRPVCYDAPVYYREPRVIVRDPVCYDRPRYRSSGFSFSYRDSDHPRHYRSRSVRYYRR